MHCAASTIRLAPPCGILRQVREGPGSSLVTDFLQRLRLQQLRLKVDLRGDSATKDFADEKWLQANAQRLEALDRLSLYFCLGRWNPPPSTPFLPTTKALKWIGIAAGGKLRPRWSLPFRRDPLEISILARRIPKRVTPMILSCRKCWPKRLFRRKYTLRAGGARTRARVAKI